MMPSHPSTVPQETHLFEGQLPGQLGAQHHHPGHPEDNQVTSCLQNGIGVETLEVSSLCEEKRR